MWIGVIPRFSQFLDNIALTDGQLADGNTSQRGITSCLNRAYWSSDSDENNRLLVGSWGKNTHVRPPRDIDILFALPAEVYHRFQQRSALNVQSQLLAEIRSSLQVSYPQTRMRSDGQVVSIPFNLFAIEVIPAFQLTSGQYWICDTNNGGRYKAVDPWAEFDLIDGRDRATNGNLRRLIRMAKVWQVECNVPLKSFVIELIAVEFLRIYTYATASLFWFDWIVRDFFVFLVTLANGMVRVPGTGEQIEIGDAWLTKAESARDRAKWACHYEQMDMVVEAGDEWQKIFGTYIPKHMGALWLNALMN
jgi:hypothetical protein